MGDAILTAIAIGVTMWLLLYVVYLVLGFIMTVIRNAGEKEKKFYSISLFRYDRPETVEFNSFGQFLLGGLKMCSLISGLGFVLVLIFCIIAALS